MKLYIEIKNGQPINHPVFENNLKAIYPDQDLSKLQNFVEFVRVKKSVGVYEVYQGVNYEFIDGKVYDVHQVRQMIESEKQDKINFVKSQWEAGGGFKSWIFNETECRFDPPIPYPEGDEIFVWNEETLSWKSIPSIPI